MRIQLTALILLCAVSIAACGSNTGSTAPAGGTATDTGSIGPEASDPWQEMRSRPLELPAIDPGSACPTTATQRVSDTFGAVAGNGPIYPGLGSGELVLGNGNVEGGWEYLKILWVSTPTYESPALIRGGQIDGDSELRFQSGPDPDHQLELPEEAWAFSPGGDPGWREWPSYLRIRGPGCYAFQIDGDDFTTHVVFRATG